MLKRPKKVAISELFFDLVYVYAIGKSTELLHHLTGTWSDWTSFATFGISFLFLINVWVYQTVFTNRYGRDSAGNRLFMLIDMGLLLLLSNTFSLEWQGNFYPFVILVALLTLTLLVQYGLEYGRQTRQEDRALIRLFIGILTGRLILVALALFLPFQWGLSLYLLGLLSGLLFPLLFARKMTLVPIHFPHLLERLSLLTIITFGELIMSGLSAYFSLETFSLQSLLFFVTVAMLFQFYEEEFFRHLNHEAQHAVAMRMIYLHYLILTGLVLISVALHLLTEKTVGPVYTVLIYFVGLGLFYLGIYLNNSYNKPDYQFSRWFEKTWLTLYLLGLLLSVLLAFSHQLVSLLTTAMVCLLTILFHRDRKHLN